MLITVTAVVILAAFALNVLHWSVYRHRFLYWPKGLLGIALNGMLIGQLVLSVAVLVGLNSASPFVVLLGGGTALIDGLFSVIRRHLTVRRSVPAAA